nr:MAG TPA: hypothetical protein [Caudoviricetes sp.]
MTFVPILTEANICSIMLVSLLYVLCRGIRRAL